MEVNLSALMEKSNIQERKVVNELLIANKTIIKFEGQIADAKEEKEKLLNDLIEKSLNLDKNKEMENFNKKMKVELSSKKEEMKELSDVNENFRKEIRNLTERLNEEKQGRLNLSILNEEMSRRLELNNSDWNKISEDFKLKISQENEKKKNLEVDNEKLRKEIDERDNYYQELFGNKIDK